VGNPAPSVPQLLAEWCGQPAERLVGGILDCLDSLHILKLSKIGEWARPSSNLKLWLTYGKVTGHVEQS
jgi:hypothetical protein